MYAAGEAQQGVLQGGQPGHAVLGDDVARVEVRHRGEVAVFQEHEGLQDLAAHALDLLQGEPLAPAPILVAPVFVPAVSLDL